MKKLPDFLLSREAYNNSPVGHGKTGTSFIDKTIHKLAGFVQLNYQQLYTSKKSFMSEISVKVRILIFILFILLISLSSSLSYEIILGTIILLINLITTSSFFKTYRRILIFSFLFGFLIALPSSLNLFGRGEVIFSLMKLSKEHQFWIYQIPQVIGFTQQGIAGMWLLTLRVFNSVSLSFLLINITPFNDIINGLKMFRIPDSLLMIFTLTYLYIIILSRSILESYLAMKARIIGHMDEKEVRHLVAGRITHIFKMSKRHFEMTYQAMLVRGYSGEVVLSKNGKLTKTDYLILGAAFVIGSLFFIFQKS